MRNVFTKFFMVSLMTLMTFSLSFGQELNTITVNSPAALAGDYQVARALFGSQSNNSITADAVFGTPTYGCSPLTTNGSGKILFINRGTCSFDVKCLNAQNSGAVAVVICAILQDETLQAMPAGSVGAQVTIPCFYASKETCDKLRVDLTGSGVNMTIKNKPCPSIPTYPSNVVWGNVPGQGDFSNGFDNWTTDNGWVYNPEGVVRNGAFTGGPKIVGSPTWCNGVAEFNHNFLDDGGLCPAPCTGFLLSPVINLTNPLTEGLAIEFSVSFRQFGSQFYIMASKDNGATFSDTVSIIPEYGFNGNHESRRTRAYFKDFEGASSVRFKFEFLMNYYYITVDDVIVLDANEDDVQVNRNWYAVAPYYKMPKSQVSEMAFLADVSNQGNKDARDVQLTVNVTGPQTNNSFDLVYGDLPARSTFENQPFPNPYKSPAIVGKYEADYVISSAEDTEGKNNIAGFQWRVTENTFGSLDTEEEYESLYLNAWSSGWAGDIPTSRIYSLGNIFYVPNGEGYVATKARYGLANPLSEVEDQFIRIDLFEWFDADNSFTSSGGERKRVGTNFQFISSEIPNLRKIETDIWASDENGEAIEGQRPKLKDDTHYIIAASVIPSLPETDPIMRLLGNTNPHLDRFGRGIGAINATNFALDTMIKLGKLPQRIAGSVQAWENVINTTIEDIDARNFRPIQNGGNNYLKAFLEMDIELAPSYTTENVLPTVAVKTFPNPAARDLFVDLSLEKVSQNVEVSMFDVEGRLVSTRIFNNIKEDRLRLDISTLTNGVYNVRIVTSEGTASRKVVVQN